MRVSVLTGSRAEYGILRPLLRRLYRCSALETSIIVTGLHLLERFGRTIEHIKSDGFEIAAEVPMYHESDQSPLGHARAFGRAVGGLADSLARLDTELLVVFGDRMEPLAAAVTAASMGLAIAHIHGGDRTDSGHIDEGIRHSITRFAHIHFAATKGHARRLWAMGEERWRVHRVGALGVDAVLEVDADPRERLFADLDFDASAPVISTIFHPVSVEKERAGSEARELCAAVKELGLQTVMIFPNNDPGSEEIIAELDRMRDTANVRVVESLSPRRFVGLLRNSALLLGNSSSGFIEAPSFKLPAVNIGSRNVGREHGPNVVFARPDRSDIIRKARWALTDPGFRRALRRSRNPYGDGRASDRIVKRLVSTNLDTRLLRKRITI